MNTLNPKTKKVNPILIISYAFLSISFLFSIYMILKKDPSKFPYFFVLLAFYNVFNYLIKDFYKDRRMQFFMNLYLIYLSINLPFIFYWSLNDDLLPFFYFPLYISIFSVFLEFKSKYGK